jgi:hypothetical protein
MELFGAHLLMGIGSGRVGLAQAHHASDQLGSEREDP